MANPSQVERTYLEIRQRIVGGRYRPGMHLAESMLARIHRSSRTPVREALSRLLQEGYVELTPKRGYRVTQVTVTLIRNMFQVRYLLEEAAAAQAASSANEEDLERLRALSTSDYEAGQPATYVKALQNNLAFHLTVAQTSHNTLLVDLVRHCLTQMDRVLSLGVDYQPFHLGTTVEHVQIIDAIASRNAARAKRAMHRHLEHSFDLLLEGIMRGEVRAVGV
jgi:DNA-binding GntR family transcriptional regulator